MSSANEVIPALMRLPPASLAALASTLTSGTLRHGYSQASLAPFCGDAAIEVERALKHLTTAGFTMQNISLLCQAMSTALAERDAVERGIQLVLSGPEVVGMPVVDTKTTVLSLFEEAEHDVLITSFVFHKASEFFELLSQRHDANPNLRVTFIVDVSHSRKSPDEAMAQLAQA